MNLKLPKEQLLLIITAGLLAIGLIVISLLQFITGSSDKKTTGQTLVTTTISPKANSSFRPITPQIFAGDKNAGTGTLEVSASLPVVFVYIDPPAEAYAEAPVSKTGKSKPVPAQYTPFKINSIPVGAHTLTAVKPGYTAQTQMVEIQKGRRTTVRFELVPWK